VRKLMPRLGLLGLAVVPAALAAADESPAPKGRKELLTSGLLDPRALREAGRHERAAATAVPPQLEAIAACESGGDPTAVGGGGQFRGKYQFTYSAWAAVGGSGDPAAAPEGEQDRRAAILYARSGPGQWPVCGA
jgi:Transglycosylase-like domain